MADTENSNNQTNGTQCEVTLLMEKKCTELLVGKTIKSVRYMYTAEKKDIGWFRKSLVIFFTDGSFLYPSADNEGNDAGAYFTSINGLEVIPTI